MTTSDDSYRPRQHDHLVEPMFGGLGLDDSGAGGEEAGGTSAGEDSRGGVLMRVLRFLGFRS